MQKKYIVILSIIIAGALAIIATGYTTVLNRNQSHANVAKTNTRISSFKAQTLEGNQYIHKTDGIVVYEIFAEWCFPCRTSVPEAVSFAKEHPEIDVVGIAFRDIEFKVKAFQKEYGEFSTTIMSNRDIEKSLGLTNAPQTLFTYENKIVYRVYGTATRDDLDNVLSLVEREFTSSK